MSNVTLFLFLFLFLFLYHQGTKAPIRFRQGHDNVTLFLFLFLYHQGTKAPLLLVLCDGPCERILRSCKVLKHLLTTLTTASGHASQCGTCGGALTALDACGGAVKALDA